MWGRHDTDDVPSDLRDSSDPNFAGPVERFEATSQNVVAARTNDGKIRVYPERIGATARPPSGITDIRAVASTPYALAAILGDSSMRAWGESGRGGAGLPSELYSGLASALSVVGNDGAFACLATFSFGKGKYLFDDLSGTFEVRSCSAGKTSDGSPTAIGADSCYNICPLGQRVSDSGSSCVDCLPGTFADEPVQTYVASLLSTSLLAFFLLP